MNALAALRARGATRRPCLTPTRSTRHILNFSVSARTRAQSPTSPASHKESYERNTMAVLRDEYSKTGGDEAVAEQDVASYGRDTDPASQLRTAGQGNPVNPLEVSPANSEVSRMTVEKEEHVESGVEKTATSKRAAPAKGKVVERYQAEEGGKAAPVGSRQVG